MKRALIVVAIAAVAALLWWFVSDAPEAAPPTAGLVPRAAAPAQPEGFAADAPPPRAETAPAAPSGAQSLPPAIDPQPQSEPSPTYYAGIVVRAADGTLLDHVLVQAVAADGTQLGGRETQQGRFELGSGILTQPASFLSFTWRDPRSEARGDDPVRQVSMRMDPATVDVPPDQIKVELDTGWIIRGKVVDEVDRDAIAAARVTERDLEVARSRVDGTFIVRDLDRAVSPLRLVVEGNGWVTATADVAAPAANAWAATVEVALAHEQPILPIPPEELPKRTPR